MPFLLVMVLTVACLPIRWPGPPTWAGYVGSIGLTWGGVILLAIIQAAFCGLIAKMVRQDPSVVYWASGKLSKWKLWHLVAMLGLFTLSLYWFGWGWVVQGGLVENEEQVSILPGIEVLIISPFILSLVLSWYFFYDVERAIHFLGRSEEESQGYWSRRSYFLFHLRHNLALVVVPVALMVLVNDIPRLAASAGWLGESLVAMLSLGLALTVFALMPWVVRMILGLRPMPESELRTRLEDLGSRLRCRCSNILIWNTRGGVANALVIGLFPFLRYIVLTDRLIQELSHDEIAAVFGHEAGHVKHRHMAYYLGFVMISLAVVTQLWQLSGIESILHLETRKHLAILPLVGLLCAYVFLVFGFVSRRCERQADIYGCRAVSCDDPACWGHAEAIPKPLRIDVLCPTGIHTFVSALEKVADVNGMNREKPGWLQSWQHSTIARRVQFLRRLIHEPSVAARFQRQIGTVKWALLLGMTCVFLALGFRTGWVKFLFE